MKAVAGKRFVNTKPVGSFGIVFFELTCGLFELFVFALGTSVPVAIVLVVMVFVVVLVLKPIVELVFVFFESLLFDILFACVEKGRSSSGSLDMVVYGYDASVVCFVFPLLRVSFSENN